MAALGRRPSIRHGGGRRPSPPGAHFGTHFPSGGGKILLFVVIISVIGKGLALLLARGGSAGVHRGPYAPTPQLPLRIAVIVLLWLSSSSSRRVLLGIRLPVANDGPLRFLGHARLVRLSRREILVVLPKYVFELLVVTLVCSHFFFFSSVLLLLL